MQIIIGCFFPITFFLTLVYSVINECLHKRLQLYVPGTTGVEIPLQSDQWKSNLRREPIFRRFAGFSQPLQRFYQLLYPLRAEFWSLRRKKNRCWSYGLVEAEGGTLIHGIKRSLGFRLHPQLKGNTVYWLNIIYKKIQYPQKGRYKTQQMDTRTLFRW